MDAVGLAINSYRIRLKSFRVLTYPSLALVAGAQSPARHVHAVDGADVGEFDVGRKGSRSRPCRRSQREGRGLRRNMLPCPGRQRWEGNQVFHIQVGTKTVNPLDPQ